MTQVAQLPLFGGAISACISPNFVDVSTFRQVPDNQEVFVDMQSDVSLIFEVVELAQETNEQNLASYHYSQLVADNDAVLLGINDIQTIATSDMLLASLGHPFFVQRLVGIMKSPKYNQSEDEVDVLLWVIRLPHVDSDVLITFNLPRQQHNHDGLSMAQIAEMETVLKSFIVRDWSLFG